ncbi:MAG: hypothetical protein M3Z20_19670 [Chloroflexota bacterium]|nr:hypothetical protein [Chloroflexota bacterium]
MHNEPAGPSSSASSRKQPAYPLHKVVAAVEPARVEQVATALAAAELDGDRVEIVTAADVPATDEPIGGSGLRGFIARLGLSLGDDLDALEEARSELGQGHVLVFVAVHDDAERTRVHDILREHGGHSMRYFGHWTITTLEGGTH